MDTQAEILKKAYEQAVQYKNIPHDNDKIAEYYDV